MQTVLTWYITLQNIIKIPQRIRKCTSFCLWKDIMRQANCYIPQILSVRGYKWQKYEDQIFHTIKGTPLPEG